MAARPGHLVRAKPHLGKHAAHQTGPSPSQRGSKRAMSESGTKRTWPDVCYESVMRTKADIVGSRLFGPVPPAERRLSTYPSTPFEQTAARAIGPAATARS